MNNEEIKFIKTDFEMVKTSHIFTIGNLEGRVIARFNTLFFKIIEDEKYIIVRILK